MCSCCYKQNDSSLNGSPRSFFDILTFLLLLPIIKIKYKQKNYKMIPAGFCSFIDKAYYLFSVLMIVLLDLRKAWIFCMVVHFSFHWIENNYSCIVSTSSYVLLSILKCEKFFCAACKMLIKLNWNFCSCFFFFFMIKLSAIYIFQVEVII
jgi:hypothetical protein